MKKHMLIKLGSILILSLIWFAGPASASLIDMGDGVIYDDVNNQYWIQDLAMFNSRSSEGVILYYAAQLAAIDALSESEEYGSYGEWRMATSDDIANLYSYSAAEIYAAFEPCLASTRTNTRGTLIGYAEYYNARYDEASASGHRQTYIYPA